jgi:ABC-2 type transport system ATP-binding protein
MTSLAIDLNRVTKRRSGFLLDALTLQLEPGQVMGLVGANGAGKSTTLRVLMGLSRHDSGDVQVLGHRIPDQQAQAKLDIGFVSHDMSLFGSATLAWHMAFVRSMYPGWDDAYARTLLRRFALRSDLPTSVLSTGERMLAMLLLVLARRPKLLILDEPTAGLDPVARHLLLAELMDLLRDDARSILFSSHNTLDVEQISDCITFIDHGRIIASESKEVYLDRWRRVHLDVTAATRFDDLPCVTDIVQQGRSAVMTTCAFTPGLEAHFQAAGIAVHEVQRMTLEEIFVATVLRIRRERDQ